MMVGRTITYVDVPLPEAARLADLSGILQDIRQAREFAQLLIAQLDHSSRDFRLTEPLCIAATVTYARAFKTGVRARLDDRALSSLTPAEHELHDWIIDYRDKHVAHSVNAFEDNTVRAQYCLETVQNDGIRAIGYGGTRTVSIGHAHAEGIVKLTEKIEVYVRERMNVREGELLQTLRSMPVEEVLSFGQRGPETPSDRDVSKRRRP